MKPQVHSLFPTPVFQSEIPLKEGWLEYVKTLNIPPEYLIEDDIKELMAGFHKWNVLNSYKQIKTSATQLKDRKNLGQKVARDGKVVK